MAWAAPPVNSDAVAVGVPEAEADPDAEVEWEAAWEAEAEAAEEALDKADETAEEIELTKADEGSLITVLVTGSRVEMAVGVGMGMGVGAVGASSGISMGTPAPLQVVSTASMVAFWSSAEQAFLVQG